MKTENEVTREGLAALSDEELNVRVAEIIGFIRQHRWPHLPNLKDALFKAPKSYQPRHKGLWGTAGKGFVWEPDLPRYCSDLNAIAEAVDKLDVWSTLLFAENLRTICNPNSDRLAKEWNDNAHARAIIAKARRRAEAFVATMSPVPEANQRSTQPDSASPETLTTQTQVHRGD